MIPIKEIPDLGDKDPRKSWKVSKINDTENLGYEFTFEDKKVTWTLEQKKAFEDAMNPSLGFKYRVKRFLTAQSDLGKLASVVKDFGLIFLPFGSTINTITDLATNQIKRTIMEDKKKKTPGKSKTIITFGLLFIVGLLQLLGVDIGLELSPDAAWLSTASGVVGIILRLITDKPISFIK